MLYWRQRVLLALLQRAPAQTASKLQLMKSLFLLREEERFSELGSYYDFVPYKYGPFSFLAYRDIQELERLGCVQIEGNCIRRNQEFPAPPKMTSGVTYSIARIAETYMSMPHEQLMRYVYGKYPWYASRSLLPSRAKIPDRQAEPGVYSLGYEGLSIDSFLSILLHAGIRAVVDSRNNPISRKYGFSKASLQGRCEDFGLEYRHYPDIGIPPENRQQAADRATLWSDYIKRILPTAADSLQAISGLCKRAPTVLICFEKNKQDCHRRILAREISTTTGLPVIDYLHEGGIWLSE